MLAVKAASYVVLAAAMAPLAWRVLDAGRAPNATFQWDCASHALNGARLAQGITKLDPAGLLRELLYPHHYPPGHSIAQLPFVLALGVDPLAARLPTVLAMAACAFLALALAIRLGADPVAAAVLLAAAFWASPHLLCMSAVPMLEVFGALGLLAFGLLYARALDDPSRTKGAALCVAALWLTASNWAVILIAAVAAHALLRHGWRRPLAAARAFLAGCRWLGPASLALHGIAVVALIAAVVIMATGGTKFGRVSMTSALAPVSIAIYAVLAHAAWVLWSRREAVRAWPVAAKAWLAWGIAPIVVWLFVLDPSRPKQTIDFMGGAASALGVLERLAYYPKAWWGDYHAAIAMAAAAGVGPAFLAARWRRLPESGRFLVVLAAVGLAALTAHSSRELRFFVGLLPLAWCLAAGALQRRWLGLAAAGLVAALSIAPARDLHRGPLAGRVRAHYLFAGLRPAAEFVGESGAAAGGSFRVFGTFDGLTWHVIEAELRRRMDVRSLRWADDFRDRRYRIEGGGEAAARAWLDRWLAREPEDTVVTISASPEFVSAVERSGFPGFRDLVFVDRWMETCPRYRPVGERAFATRGLRVRVWKKR
jgi:hypothetical protein